MDYQKLDNSIVVCSSTIKNKILKQNILLNIKIMNINELMKKLTFDYDDKAILKVISNENVKYSLAKMYLDNIYYVENKEYKNKKLNKLKQIKDYVKEDLIYDDLFKEYIKNKKIIIINHRLSKYEKKVLKDYNYEELELRNDIYDHDVYVFKYLEDEVKYIGYKICELVESGTSLDKIKLYNVSSDYEQVIRRNFGFLNLKVNFKSKRPLIATIPGKEFVSRLDNDNIENIIEDLKNKYDSKIVNKIISICNKYVWSNYNKTLIIECMKNTNLSDEKYENGIEIIENLEALDDEYVFLMGFNEGTIPRSYKDEDYINDAIKMDYLENTVEKNIISKNETLKNIRSIKNLIITTKLKDNKQTFYVSNLLENKKEIDYTSLKTYSKLLDKIEYTAYLDDYNKYGTINKKIGVLSNTYQIPYKKYNHEYKKIENLRFPKKLELSYTSFENYNECNFKYYVSKILKLDIFENTFSSMVGSLVHEALERNLRDNTSIDDVINEFISNNELTNKERFFVKKLKVDLKKIVKIIKEQQSMGDLNDALYEQKIVVENENYNLVGKIDKILYKKDNDNTIVTLIDYKTGNANINFKYKDYGLNMQLPIYIYLVNHSKLKNIKIAGFYLQKIHLEVPKKTDKSLDDILKDNLKLEGYSNKNKDYIRLIDENFENSSIIKSMKVKKDGDFYVYSKVLSDEEIDNLSNFTEQKLDEAASKILKGEFNINPKKIGKDNLGCQFCKFKDICYMEDYDIVKIEKGDDDDTEETA